MYMRCMHCAYLIYPALHFPQTFPQTPFPKGSATYCIEEFPPTTEIVGSFHETIRGIQLLPISPGNFSKFLLLTEKFVPDFSSPKKIREVSARWTRGLSQTIRRGPKRIWKGVKKPGVGDFGEKKDLEEPKTRGFRFELGFPKSRNPLRTPSVYVNF